MVLSCEAVSYSYLDRFPALDSVTLDVRAGDQLALLGANGCGKSTLLKILDGLMFPSTGTFEAFGVPITEKALDDEQLNRAFRSRVGFVFQNSDAQAFSASVFEEVAFGCLQLGLDADATRARVRETLAMLAIEHLVDRPPHRLSGGEKKKVAIASVLVMGPEVLLFDEPTAGLDPRTQFWLLDLLGQLSDAGKTIVLATHDLGSLTVVADRAVVLGEDHRIWLDSTPDAVLADRDLLVRANLVHPRAR